MFLERIQLKNLLSFGPESEEIELRPLNVLIGPNGCGKSNFIEAIGLLRAAPTDLAAPMRNGRGVADWIWQGELKADSARIDAVVRPASQSSLRYSVEFAERPQGFTVINETLTSADGDPRCFFKVSAGSPIASIRIDRTRSEPRRAGLLDAVYKDYPIENRKSVLPKSRMRRNTQNSLVSPRTSNRSISTGIGLSVAATSPARSRRRTCRMPASLKTKQTWGWF